MRMASVEVRAQSNLGRKHWIVWAEPEAYGFDAFYAGGALASRSPVRREFGLDFDSREDVASPGIFFELDADYGVMRLNQPQRAQ
jgi:hypothetical protein